MLAHTNNYPYGKSIATDAYTHAAMIFKTIGLARAFAYKNHDKQSLETLKLGYKYQEQETCLQINLFAATVLYPHTVLCDRLME
jgi:hypothetical protein